MKNLSDKNSHGLNAKQRLIAFIIWGFILIIFLMGILHFYSGNYSWKSNILMSNFMEIRDFSILVLSVSTALATTLLYNSIKKGDEPIKGFLEIILFSLTFSYIIMWVLCFILWTLLTTFNLL